MRIASHAALSPADRGCCSSWWATPPELITGALHLLSSPPLAWQLELYWLPSMEALRQSPQLLRITQRLYARTWATGSAAFKASQAPKRPSLAFYVDRTSLRLPGNALEPLRAGCGVSKASGRGSGFVLRIPVPLAEREALRLRISGFDHVEKVAYDDDYEVCHLLDDYDDYNHDYYEVRRATPRGCAELTKADGSDCAQRAQTPPTPPRRADREGRGGQADGQPMDIPHPLARLGG